MSQDEAEPNGEAEKAADEEPAPERRAEAPILAVEHPRPGRLWVRQLVEGLLSGVRWPLLAFLLLLAYGVFAFAPGSVESVVRERVRSQLAGQWLGFATVEVSGQNVVLRGTPPEAGDADRALLLAERTTCPTLFGDLDCTVDVRGEFQPPAAAARATRVQVDACDRELAALLSRSSIEFQVSGAAIRPESRALLAELAAVAARCPGRLRVEGHADERRRADANLRLSRERAEAVCDALVALGVARDRLVAEGLGETRPIATNDTADGRARNRRIEIRVIQE